MGHSNDDHSHDSAHNSAHNLPIEPKGSAWEKITTGRGFLPLMIIFTAVVASFGSYKMGVAKITETRIQILDSVKKNRITDSMSVDENWDKLNDRVIKLEKTAEALDQQADPEPEPAQEKTSGSKDDDN